MDLAHFVRSIRTVPAPVRHSAARAVFDLLGTALAGAGTAAAIAASRAARSTWGCGPAAVWFGIDRLTPPGAAFVNATYASILDLDDGHRGAAGHPGAAMIPAALATAEASGADADSLLTAIVIGYEVGLRAAAARSFDRLRTTDTGQWCGIGAAAAAGWLRSLSADQIAHAMAIAGHTASGQFASGWTRLGHSVKEGIPWATAGGLAAVDLAAAGQTGPIDFLDDPAIYDRTRLQRDLGRRWAIDGGYFKIYSCCRWAHAAIDGALALAALHGLAATEIETIEIRTFSRACRLNNEAAPMTSEGAQYSVPFCVALALVHGPGALMPLGGSHLSDRAVTDLAKRVRLDVDPRLDAMFPASAPARVTLLSGSRRYELEVTTPKGEPSNPLSDRELDEKFDALARLAAPGLSVPALKAGLSSLPQGGSIDRLIAALQPGPAPPLGRAP